MVAVAPGDVVAVFDEADPGVVAVFPLEDLGIGAGELDGILVDLPVEAVLAEAGVKIHAQCLGIAAEYAGEAVFERNYGAVEDAVGVGFFVAADHRVFGVAPDGSGGSGGLFLPGDVGEGGGQQLAHKNTSFL